MQQILLAVVVAVAMVAAAVPHPPADAAKLAAIAAALPERPGGGTRYDRAATGSEVKRAKALAKQPVAEVADELYLEFTTNGNRTHYQQAISRRYASLYALVAAECSEKQGTYIAKIAEYLDVINNQRSWVWPAHDRSLDNFHNRRLTIDLVSSDLALQFAQILTALGDRLPPATAAKTRAEIFRRVLDLYREDVAAAKPRNWWFYGNANWTAVCHAGVVRAALLMIKDRNERARFVEAGMRGMQCFLSGFTPDGYCSEGMGYWEYGFGHYLDFGLAVKSATGGAIDVFAEGGERARAAAGYPFAFQLQANVAPHFADGGGNPSRKRREVCAGIWPDLKSSLTGALPIRSVFPDAQVYISRAPGDRPVGLAVKGGHNREFHNHNDVGSWTFMIAGEEIAGDPDGEEYTARTFSKDRYVSDVLNSFGHPVPRVAGALQSEGEKFRAKVLKVELTEVRDTVTMDIAGAYRAKDLVKLERTTVFDRAERSFAVADEVAFASPQAFDVPIVTYCEVERGAEPGRFVLKTKKGTRAVVTINADGGEWELQETEINNPNRPSPKRLSVTFKRPVAAARVRFDIKEEK